MLLNHDEIQLLLNEGVVENSGTEYINQTSLDITLGAEIIEETADKYGTPLNLRNRESFSSRATKIGLGYSLHPGQFVLASSQQIFNLPDYISAEYKLKSSMARTGLEHLNAGWCDPGWHGSCLTLELKNMLNAHSILLHEGDRIGQVVFFKHNRVRRDKSYATVGRYNNDKTVHGVK